MTGRVHYSEAPDDPGGAAVSAPTKFEELVAALRAKADAARARMREGALREDYPATRAVEEAAARGEEWAVETLAVLRARRAGHWTEAPERDPGEEG